MAFLPIIAAVAGIGSSLIGAVGAIQQGNAAKDAANYNAQVKENQAIQEQNNATAVASNDAIKTRQRAAAARAGAIQNGFESDGSVTDILRSVQTDGALEGMTALYEGGTRAQALRSGASMDRAAGANAQSAGYLNAGTSILSGASKLYTGGRNAF